MEKTKHPDDREAAEAQGPPVNMIRILDERAIGAIEIPRLPEGGVVVIEGMNGLGKTTAINAVATLLGSKEKLEARDGTPMAVVEGLGARVTSGARQKRTGDLAVVPRVDHVIDPAKFVDPRREDPASRDALRVQWLLATAGVRHGPEIWYPVAGGQKDFDRMVGSTSDLSAVEIAGKLKRGLEDDARGVENESEVVGGRADGEEQLAARVPQDTPSDELVLRQHHTDAVAALATALQRQRGAAETIRLAGEATKLLAQAGNAVSIAAAEDSVAMARDAVAAARTELDRHTERATSARELLSDAMAREVAATQVAQQSRARDTNVERYRRVVAEAEGVKPVSDLELVDLRADVAAAERALLLGKDAREAAGHRREAEALRQQRADLTAHATALRNSARRTEEVLGELVAAAGLAGITVRSGRMFIPTDRPSGEEAVDDLSRAELLSLAVPPSCRACGPGGVLPMAQELWEGLDAYAKRFVWETARAIDGVTVITAHEGAGALQVKVYEPTVETSTRPAAAQHTA